MYNFFYKQNKESVKKLQYHLRKFACYMLIEKHDKEHVLVFCKVINSEIKFKVLILILTFFLTSPREKELEVKTNYVMGMLLNLNEI